MRKENRIRKERGMKEMKNTIIKFCHFTIKSTLHKLIIAKDLGMAGMKNYGIIN